MVTAESARFAAHSIAARPLFHRTHRLCDADSAASPSASPTMSLNVASAPARSSTEFDRTTYLRSLGDSRVEARSAFAGVMPNTSTSVRAAPATFGKTATSPARRDRPTGARAALRRLEPRPRQYGGVGRELIEAVSASLPVNFSLARSGLAE